MLALDPSPDIHVYVLYSLRVPCVRPCVLCFRRSANNEERELVALALQVSVVPVTYSFKPACHAVMHTIGCIKGTLSVFMCRPGRV